VVEGRRQAWLGSIQLVRPVPLAVLTMLVLLTAVAVGAYLFEGRYTRKAHVVGYLVPDQGVRRVSAPQGGVVIESRAREGLAVHRGDTLYVLSLGRLTASGSAQAAVQDSLSTRRSSLEAAARRAGELDRQQLAALDRELAEMRTELVQIDSSIELQQQK